jgi:hypothetical protein
MSHSKDRVCRLLQLNLWSLLAVAIISSGCATRETIASRKQRYPTAYAGLSPAEQEAVDAGKLLKGLGTNAVYIALGTPGRQFTHHTPAEEILIWTYDGTYVSEERVPVTRVYDGGRNGTVYSVMEYDVRKTPKKFKRLQLEFVNGVLRTWEEYPPPLANSGLMRP